MAQRTETIKITGMTCVHCKNSVDRVIKELPGISGIDISLEKKSANVSFDDTLTSKEEIIKAVNDTETYHAE